MKILDTVRAALRSPDASSSELRAALSAIDLPALETAVRQAERHRTGLLFDGTDDDVDVADVTLKVAIRERDRAVAAQAELGKRLVNAEAADAAGALDAERSAVEREAKAVDKLLREKWVRYQAELVTLLDRLDDAERAVIEVNGRLGAAGRSDLISPVEERAFPVPTEQYPAVHSIRNRTQFRPMEGAPGWRDELPPTPMNFGVPTDADGKPLNAAWRPAPFAA